MPRRYGSGVSLQPPEDEPAYIPFQNLNREAKFYAAHPSLDSLPAIEVAGVLVFVYVNADGDLRVSVDLDTAIPEITDAEGNVPLEIAVSGEVVAGL